MNPKLILIAVALWCSAATAGEPQRILPGVPNQNPKQLIHSYMVAAPKQLAHQAQALEKLAQKNQWQGIEAVSSLDSLPDVVFVLDNNTPESAQITAEAEKRNAYVVSLAPKSRANLSRIEGLINARYFSGKRPTYSTVFSAADGQYNNYRIPSVVTTSNGTVVAFTEGRAFLKDQAENDIVARRSTDGGATWGPMIVVVENGKASLNNPMVISLSENRLVLLYQDYPPQINEGNAQRGAVRCFVVTSEDGGATWSAPRDITAQVTPDGATSFCTGPGVGIVLTQGAHQGRIVVPCNVNAPVWYNYLIYSDDNGVTWHQMAGRSAYGMNESQVVEVGADSLLVVARCHRNIGDTACLAPKGWSPWNFERVTRRRAQTLVVDGVWSPVEVRQELVDPTCQGSVVRVGDLLLLSNPASDYTVLDERPYRGTPPMRINGSVRYSRDGGRTWSPAKRIYGNRHTEFQYSVLTPMGGDQVGCLFEANRDLKFAVLDLEWLTN